MAPAAVLCLFALALPARISGGSTGASRNDCLTLAEQARSRTGGEVSLLEECSALYPGDVELLADLATAYETTDRRRAEAVYRRALSLDPGFADLRLHLGELLLRRGAAAEALAQADAGLVTQPNRHAFVDLRARALVASRP